MLIMLIYIKNVNVKEKNEIDNTVKIDEIKENEEKLKQSVRMALIGNKYSCKPIRCVETQIVYEGVFAAYKNTNINMSNISSVCNGKRKTAGGYHWEYVKGGD